MQLKVYTILYFIYLFFAHSVVFSQSPDRKWGLGLGGSVLNFQLPPEFPIERPQNIDPALYITLSRYLNGAFDFATDIFLANDIPYPSSSGTFSNGFFSYMSYNFRFKFNNGIFIRESSFFAPYLSLGIGGSYHRVASDVFFPFGGGIRFRLGPKWNLLTSARRRSSFNDNFQSTSYTIGLIFSLATSSSYSKYPSSVPADTHILLANINLSDMDGDGLIDSQDDCPNEAGLPIYDGCPTDSSYLDPGYISHLDKLMRSDSKQVKQQDISSNNNSPREDIYNPQLTNSLPNKRDDQIDILHEKANTEFPQGEGNDPLAQDQNLSYSNTEPPLQGGEESGNFLEGEEKPFSANELKEHPAALQQNPLRKEALPCSLPNFVSLGDVRIQFDIKSDTIKQKEISKLSQIAEIMLACENAKLRIKGYANDDENFQRNKILSVMRAFNTKYYLVNEWQISQSRIFSDGYVKASPLSANSLARRRGPDKEVNFEIFFH